MAKEDKEFSRRSFLKGAASVIAAAPGAGLFIKDAGAQGQPAIRFPRTKTIQEPPNVTQDEDVVPLAKNLFETALDGAYDVYEAAAEKFVKSGDKSMHVGNALNSAGLRLISKEVIGRAKAHAVSPSIIKVRELQLKQKGWHNHAYAEAWPVSVHWNVTW
jgi:hypothetical protein